MTNHKSILITLRTIDNQTGFSIRNDAEIGTLIRNNLASSDVSLDTFALAEFYAFTLYENSPRGKKLWKTYFGSPLPYNQSGKSVTGFH